MSKPLGVSFYIASSSWFVAVAGVFYASMSTALWIAYLPWWVGVLGTAVLAIDFRRVIALHGLRTHKNSVSILSQDCDKWQYELHSGRCCKGALIRKKSYCSALFIILYMQHMIGGRYIVIPRDALSDHNYRLLAFKLNCS